jgi:carbamate kinase
MNRLVLSLGGNAFTGDGEQLTMSSQFAFAESTLAPMSSLLKAQTQVLITHGNGPQVGFILTRVEEALGKAYTLPLEVCVAESEGELGYVLQQTIHNVTGGKRPSATLLTQVKVDPNDPAFQAPTKPIGPFLDEHAAQRLIDQNLEIIEDAGRGFRRVVPSPMPIEIIEIDIIDKLLSLGIIVIAAGGGGIPVIETDSRLNGIEAVVDKDFASAMLATELRADRLLLVTCVDAAYTNFNSPKAQPIHETTTTEMKQLVKAGHFLPGSMKPKVLAAIQYVDATGNVAVICHSADIADALAYKAGTIIRRDHIV